MVKFSGSKVASASCRSSDGIGKAGGSFPWAAFSFQARDADAGARDAGGTAFDPLDAEIMLAWAATARVRYGATVAIGLLPEDLPGFEKNWTATKWRHAAMTPDEVPRLREPVPILIVPFGKFSGGSFQFSGVCEGGAPAPRTPALDLPASPIGWDDRQDADATLRDAHRQDADATLPPSPDAGAPLPSVCFVEPMDAVAVAEDEPPWTYAMAAAAESARTEWLIYLDPMMHPSPGAELFLPHRLPGWTGDLAAPGDRDVYAPGWAFRKIGSAERGWVERVFARHGADPPGQPDLAAGHILKHLRLGPSATMIGTALMREAFAEWRSAFTDMPFEIYLTLRCRALWPGAVEYIKRRPEEGGDPDADPEPRPHYRMGICRPQDWGWNT
ncbi:MAG: hypothetical protein R3F11_27980 [Verrucomicrobiales bacterium]